MPHVDLTDRQLDVIAAIARGDTRAQTAALLHVSEATITRETRHASHALNVRGYAALVDAALRQHLLPTKPGPPQPLPDRLHKVLVLVASGLSNGEIAPRLHLSVDGVKVRMKCLQQELNARDRAHAVAIGHQRGLLDRKQWTTVP